MLSDLKLCRFYFVKNLASATLIVTRTTLQGGVGSSNVIIFYVLTYFLPNKTL